MVLSKLIPLSLVLCFFSFAAHAQEKFLRICNDPLAHEKTIQNDIKWLKYFFKTKSCDEISKKLSALRSFTEFMVPAIGPEGYHASPWEVHSPLPRGPKTTLELSGVFYDAKINSSDLFKRLDLYSEFENLTHIAMDFYNYSDQDFCEILDTLPQLTTMALSDFYLPKLKGCEKIPSLIITKDSFGKFDDALREKVIGFEYFNGMNRDLARFRNLQYLHMPHATEDNLIEAIAQNNNLTHLALTVRRAIKNPQNLNHLTNLRYLKLNCIGNSLDVLTKNAAPETCSKPPKDLGFLSKLDQLRYLDLRFNALKNVSFLSSLKDLEYLDVSHNQLVSLPDLKLPKLKVLKSENNLMETN